MDWRIVVKDKYPAYISWDTFEKIQIMLRDNRAEYLRTKSRGIPRDGAALLHGITWCGECGHKMFVRYKGGSQYVCNHLRQQHDVPVCQCLRAAPIDAQVAAAFLEAVAPAEIDALSRARKVQMRADEALRHAEEQQVQRLRYQAALAERQFNRVDPDNRLVAGELERRWEAALIELRRAEEALARSTASTMPQPVGVDPRLRAKVVALGERLPALWADPATRREHRKALLRCLIEKVVMRRSARDQAEVRIVWRGGATTELTVMMPVNALSRASAPCRDGAARLRAGRRGSLRRRDRANANGRRTSLAMARHGGSGQHGSGYPHSPRREGTTENSLACGLRLFDGDAARRTARSFLRSGYTLSSGVECFGQCLSPLVATSFLIRNPLCRRSENCANIARSVSISREGQHEKEGHH